MDFIEVERLNGLGSIRFSLSHLVCYNDEMLVLSNQILEISPGTSQALDKLLKERSACAFLKVEAVREGS